ncbi:MAG: LemA family protein [Muribaculaceae bacterium]|nr:LemA family protein [Muribaculaceae bacterium]
MKKSYIALAVVAVLLILGVGCCSTRNGIVSADQNVKKSWGNVEAAYQYRFDLIPNLVSTVKGYAKHEASTLQNVTDARVGRVSDDGDKLQALADSTQAQLHNPQQTPEQRQEMLSKFQKEYSIYVNAVHEAYPQLQASQNFLALQDQLTGTESRIKTARDRFNEAVEAYNNKILRFPGSLFAWGYTEKNYFEADAAASTAPKADFGDM